jgi:hypothetical protein
VRETAGCGRSAGRTSVSDEASGSLKDCAILCGRRSAHGGEGAGPG